MVRHNGSHQNSAPSFSRILSGGFSDVTMIVVYHISLIKNISIRLCFDSEINKIHKKYSSFIGLYYYNRIISYFQRIASLFVFKKSMKKCRGKVLSEGLKKV